MEGRFQGHKPPQCGLEPLWSLIPKCNALDPTNQYHYGDVMSGAIASQITGLTICLLNRLFGCRSKKTSKLRVTGLFVGNSPGTGEIPAQMASNAENVSIWWRHHATSSITLQILFDNYRRSSAIGCFSSPTPVLVQYGNKPSFILCQPSSMKIYSFTMSQNLEVLYLYATKIFVGLRTTFQMADEISKEICTSNVDQFYSHVTTIYLHSYRLTPYALRLKTRTVRCLIWTHIVIDDILKCIFLIKNRLISMNISLTYNWQ